MMSIVGNNTDLVDQIIQYEAGELDTIEMLNLFGDLIKSGTAWTLQGSYGRAAKDLIDGEWIDPQGNLNEDKISEELEN